MTKMKKKEEEQLSQEAEKALLIIADALNLNDIGAKAGTAAMIKLATLQCNAQGLTIDQFDHLLTLHRKLFLEMQEQG